MKSYLAGMPRSQPTPFRPGRLEPHGTEAASAARAFAYSRNPNTNIACPAAIATYCFPPTE